MTSLRLSGRLADEQDGVAAVEFSIVSMFLLALLYAILMYGFIFGTDQSITHAAAEGARAAISQATGVTQEQHAKDVALDRLSWLHGRITESDITTTLAPCAPPDEAYNCLTVRIVYPWRARPIIPPVLNIAVPDEIVAETTVQVD